MKDTIDILLQHPGVEAFGLAILHSLWQGALVAIGLFVMLQFVKYNSNLRYILACGGLLCLLLAFGFTFYLSYAPPFKGAGSSSDPEFSTSVYKVSNLVVPQIAEVMEAKTFSFTSYYAAISEWIERNAHYIFGIWLMGFLAFSSRIGFGLYYANKLKRNCQSVEDAWIQKLEQFRSMLGIKSSVQLLTSGQVHTPLTLGWLQPVILLPVGMLTQLPYEHLESILLHELAHIKRQDYFINLLQSVVESLLFFNPTYWYIARMIERERENACDDMAVSNIQHPINYAKALTRVAELSKADWMVSKTTVAANRGSLTTRIRRIVLASTGQTIQRSEKTKWFLMSTILVAVLGTILITEDVRGDQSKISEGIFTTHEMVVSGKVGEADSGKPLPGINVSVQGEETGTVTNSTGNYSLRVPSGSDTLIFALKGYKTKRIQIDSLPEINIDLDLDIDVDQEINIEEEINVEIELEEDLDLDIDLDVDTSGARVDSTSLYHLLSGQWEHIKKQKEAKGEEMPDNVLLSNKTLFIIDGEARDPRAVKPPFDYTMQVPQTVMWAAMRLFDYLKDEDAYAAFREKYPGDYDNVMILTSKSLKPEINPDGPFTVTGHVINASSYAPISGAKVWVKGAYTNTVTDSEGNYGIRVPNANAVLVFSHEGNYIDVEQPVKWHQDGKLSLFWQLSPNKLKNLPDVEIQTVADTPHKTHPTLKEAINSSDTGSIIATASSIHLLINQVKKDLPMYIVDGVELRPEFVTKLDPENLKMIEVIRKTTAIEHFGEKGKNGVVLVTTKKAIQEGHVQISSLTDSLQPLYIVDGKQFNDQEFTLATLSPDDIASVDVLKGEEAIKKYGEDGVNGVIIIKTKSKKGVKPVDMGPSFDEVMDKATDGMLDSMTLDEIYNYHLTVGQMLNRQQKGINNYMQERGNPTIKFNFLGDNVLFLLDGLRADPWSIKSYDLESIEVIRKDVNTSYQENMKGHGYLGNPNAPEKFEEYLKKYPGDYDAVVIAKSKNKSKVSSITDDLSKKTDILTVFPNPSENIFTILFTVEEDASVQAAVISPSGVPVTTLTDRKFAKGKHEIEWDATTQKPGLYRIRITQGSETVYRNVLVK